MTLVAPGPHPSVVQQVIAETKSGVKPSLDLFPTALSLLTPLREAGAVAKVDWAALGVPAEQIGPPGDNVQISTIARNIIYNTSLVKKDEAPKRIEDLADPKWKGKIVAPAIADVFTVMGVPVIGEPATIALVRKLAKDQKISLVQSVTDVGSKVANGEFALGIGVPADWTGAAQEGRAGRERAAGEGEWPTLSGGRAGKCRAPGGRDADGVFHLLHRGGQEGALSIDRLGELRYPRHRALRNRQ